jgi:hypothetical protein
MDEKMSTSEVGFENYVRGIRCSGPSVAVLMARLEKAQPPDLTPPEKKAFKLLQQRAHQVELVLAARDRLAPGRLRPVLLSHADGWNALYEALVAKSRIPVSISDVGARASALVGSLFADGTSFTQLDAETAWSEAQRRLTRIVDEELEHELTQLVGPELLEVARAATTTLGNAIGTRGDAEAPSSTALQEALALFGRAVGAYGRALAANCDEDDDASVQRFLKAVAPIDLHRANMRAGSDAGDTTDPTSTSTTQPALAQQPTSSGGVPAPSANPTSGGTTPSPVPAPVDAGSANGSDVAAA